LEAVNLFLKHLRIKDKRKLGISLGFLFAISNSIVLTFVFFAAYFNDYQVMVNVNAVGEAHFEAVIVPVLLLVSIVGFVCYVKDSRVRCVEK
jgi:preprotein translocase subunit SecY